MARCIGVVPIGTLDPADVVGTRRAQCVDGAPHVAVGQLGVAVDAHDDLARGGADGGVEAGGRAAGGVVDHDHPVVVVGEVRGHAGRVVVGRGDGQDQLQRPRVVLRQHGPRRRTPEVGGLVAHGHDHRDARPLIAHAACPRLGQPCREPGRAGDVVR